MIGTHRGAGIVAAAVLAAGTAVIAAPGGGLTAHAAVPACPTLNGTTLTVNSAKAGTGFIVCNGTVATFDGTPLDVDVTIPTAVPTSAPPLVMLLSGYSNDICQFESLTPQGMAVPNCGTNDYIGNPGYDWNNAWFAGTKGDVTLTYTPRGWYESCGKVFSAGGSVVYSYATDPNCSGRTVNGISEQSWVHLYDRRFEIRDAQFLAGLLVDAGLVDPQRIITSGDSGGGGPSWDLALSQDRVVQITSTVTPAAGTPPWTSSIVTAPWTSPNGTAMHLAAAIPMFTWTDLVDSLVQNGTSSDCLAAIAVTCFSGKPADGTHDAPVGVEKQSYVSGLFLKGVTDIPSEPQYSAQYAAPRPSPLADPTADLFDWFAEINAGEPTFGVNPDAPTIIAQIGGPLRSPFSIPVPATDRIPIFVIQGDTDPLFPSLQALTMINRLKAADASYPVWGFLGDVGHSYAQNPLAAWQQAHALSNQFITDVLQGVTPAEAPVTVVTDTCAGQTPTTYSTAASSPQFQTLATSILTFTGGTAAQSTTSAPDPAAVAEGAALDPIANSGCPSTTAPSDPLQATYTFPVSTGFTLMGGPVINVTAALTAVSPDGSAELAARLFDVNPAGTAYLVGRTVYRLSTGTQTSTNPLSFEISPNAWQFCAGDTLKLELTQVDTPSWRADNEMSTMSLSGMGLSLPVIANTGCAVANTPETPLVPLLPLAALLAGGAVALVRRRRGIV